MNNINTNFNQDCLLTRGQAAEILGVTESALAHWAYTKRYNLPMVKIGRLVKYRKSDLENFITQGVIAHEGK